MNLPLIARNMVQTLSKKSINN